MTPLTYPLTMSQRCGSNSPGLRLVDPSHVLPRELLIEILDILDHASIMHVAHTSALYRSLALQHDLFYRTVNLYLPEYRYDTIHILQQWSAVLLDLSIQRNPLALSLFMQHDLQREIERDTWTTCVAGLARCIPICKRLTIQANNGTAGQVIQTKILREQTVQAALLVELSLSVWATGDMVNLPNDILADRSPRLRTLHISSCGVAAIDGDAPSMANVRVITAQHSTLGPSAAFFDLFPNIDTLYMSMSTLSFAIRNDTQEVTGPSVAGPTRTTDSITSRVRPRKLQLLVFSSHNGTGYDVPDLLDLKGIRQVELLIRGRPVEPSGSPFNITAFLESSVLNSDSLIDMKVAVLSLPEERTFNMGSNVADVKATFSIISLGSSVAPRDGIWRVLRGQSGVMFSALGILSLRSRLCSITLPAVDANLAELFREGRDYPNLKHIAISVRQRATEASFVDLYHAEVDSSQHEPLARAPNLEALELYLDAGTRNPQTQPNQLDVLASEVAELGRALGLHRVPIERRPVLRLRQLKVRDDVEGAAEMWLFRHVQVLESN